MGGFLDVPNCGLGHLQIKFNRSDGADVDKARRVIQDMLKRGYALFVEIGGDMQRVQSFDPERDEYILKDPIEITGEEKVAEPTAESKNESQSKEITPTEAAGTEGTPPLRETKRTRRLPIRHARATGIAPTAGG